MTIISVASTVLFLAAAAELEQGDVVPKAPQVIILKLDDVTAHEANGRPPVSPRWQRTADFIEKSNLKASFGIIGFSLEQDNQAYFDWIKNLHKTGNVEFWNHGYRNRKAEDKTGEFEGSLEEQTAALRKTQTLAREKLGIELKVFGPHWNGTNQDTEKALAAIPEIKAWFYGPKGSKKFVFEEVLTLENPIFVPDPDKFKEIYERRAQDKPCLALQGHANQWDDQRWQGFVKIIEYLKSKGCVFMTPSAYLEKATSGDRACNATMWMMPPSYDNGRCFRELFEQPNAWQETRSVIDVLGYADHNLNKQFTDDQLQAWLPKLQHWGIKLALEVGALKPWGTTGEKTFNIERPTWDRVERLGGSIYAIAMDEPLCCARKEIRQPDDYAVEETARFIALVRKHYPQVLIGDIEPYPFIPLPDLIQWIEALEKRLAQMHVAGLDFFRLDVDWLCFTVRNEGSWREVKKLEQYCRNRKLAFSLIYWASGYPAMERRGLADDSTWYASTMQQGYDYAAVDGAPDQYVVESWIGAPARCVPETGEFTFTRSVRDFSRKFAKRGAPSR